MVQISSWGITVIFSIVSLALAVLSFIYGRLKEGRDRADANLKEVIEKSKEEATIKAEMKFINQSIQTMNSNVCGQIGEIEGRLKNQEEESSKKRERLAVVEQAAKSAHHRLDNHEERIHILEKKGV